MLKWVFLFLNLASRTNAGTLAPFSNRGWFDKTEVVLWNEMKNTNNSPPPSITCTSTKRNQATKLATTKIDFHNTSHAAWIPHQRLTRSTYAATNAHVPQAERNNRTIKERVRAAFHWLPYAAIPVVLLRQLVELSAAKLNYFPSRMGLSSEVLQP